MFDFLSGSSVTPHAGASARSAEEMVTSDQAGKHDLTSSNCRLTSCSCPEFRSAKEICFSAILMRAMLIVYECALDYTVRWLACLSSEYDPCEQ